MAAMFAPSRSTALSRALSSSPAAAAARGAAPTAAPATRALPGFLLPAWQTSTQQGQQQQQQQQRQRPFSTTAKRASKLGRTPISVPPGVELVMGEPRAMRTATSFRAAVKKTITVTGPLGTLTLDVPEFVRMEEDAGNKTVSLSIDDIDVKQQKEMWGTTWAYLRNHITGVSEGHTAILRLVGVGYRASVERRAAKEAFPGQHFLCLKLGFTHPVDEGIPPGVKVSTPQPTRILLEGPDREALMSFAGRVKQWRKPEPYKGKGVFINDETIKLKSKKIS